MRIPHPLPTPSPRLKKKKKNLSRNELNSVYIIKTVIEILNIVKCHRKDPKFNL